MKCARFLVNSIAFFIFFIISCKKETPFSEPKLTTPEVSIKSSTSIHVKSKLLDSGTETIEEMGLITGISSPLTKENAILAYTNSEVLFTGLKPDQKYYFRSYVITKKDFYYSDEIGLSTTTPMINPFEKDTILRGETITLLGENLSEDSSLYKVTIGNTEAQVVSTSLNELEVRVPINFDSGWKEIKVHLNDVVVDFNEKIFISKWGKGSLQPSYLVMETGVLFAFKNKVYSIMDSYWDKNDEVHDRNVWEYDISNNNWNIKPNQFPGKYRIRAKTCVHKDKGYLAMGYEDFKDFWEYDPNLDSWKELTSVPDSFSQKSIMVTIGENIYLYDDRKLAVYNAEINQWEFKAPLDIAITAFLRSSLGFGIDNKGYFLARSKKHSLATNRMFEYNPQLDQWTELEANVPERAGYLDNFFCFTHIGAGVYGNGNFFSELYNEYWTFNPGNGDWHSFHKAPQVFNFRINYTANKNQLFVKQFGDIYFFNPD